MGRNELIPDMKRREHAGKIRPLDLHQPLQETHRPLDLKNIDELRLAILGGLPGQKLVECCGVGALEFKSQWPDFALNFSHQITYFLDLLGTILAPLRRIGIKARGEIDEGGLEDAGVVFRERSLRCQEMIEVPDAQAARADKLLDIEM